MRTAVIPLAAGRALSLPGRASTEVVGAPEGAASTLRIVEIAPETPDAPRRGPHVHDGFEEVIHVAAGTGVMQTDGGELPLKPGDTVLVHPGERHATYNTGAEPLRLVCFFPVPDIRPGTREFPGWDTERTDG